MNMVTLCNGEIDVSISLHGAELCSVKDVVNGKEYMWNADPAFWGRHAPVLFPFVGALKDKQYRYRNQSYPMGQHGFARDMDFTVESKSENVVWFVLNANQDTLLKYPFLFALHIGYRLNHRSIEVMWKVENLDCKTMYFAIGAHPAFYCPFSQDKEQPYYVKLYDTKQLSAYYVDQSNGLKKKNQQVVALDSIQEGNGYLKLTDELFAKDALIVEHTNITKIAICDSDKMEYVTVTFDAPLFGLWSPVNKAAPFICIEPWYGRCDAVDFNGEISEKEYINVLKVGELFEKSYLITF